MFRASPPSRCGVSRIFPGLFLGAIAGVAVAAALLALLFSTDVYTAWMFTLTLLIAAVLAVAAAVGARFSIGEVPVWQAASAVSGARLLLPGWPVPADRG